MGSTSGNTRYQMEWERDLAGAKKHGAKIMQVCPAGCGQTIRFEIDALIAEHGPAYSLYDRQPPCANCGEPTHFMCWAGNVYRPMRSGKPSAADRRIAHRHLLQKLGLSVDDWVRIKALAERVAAAPDAPLEALDDLAAPVRISAVPKTEAWRYSGLQLGTWAGQAVLMWRMSARDREEWRSRMRRSG